MFAGALHTYYETYMKEIPRAMFAEFEGVIEKKVAEFAASLSQEERDRLRAAHSDAPLTAEQTKYLQKVVHDELVIGEADKESGRYTFTCRALHDEWLSKEVDGEQSNYSKEDCDEKTVYQRQFNYCLENKYISTLHPSPKDKELEKKQGRAFTQFELFQRRTAHATLYVTLKTHKQPIKPRFVAGGTKNPCKQPCQALHRALFALKPYLDDLQANATRDIEATDLKGRFAKDNLESSIVNSSADVVRRVRNLKSDITHMEQVKHTWPEDVRQQRRRHTRRRRIHFGVHDFTSLFTTFQHNIVRDRVRTMLTRIFDLNSKEGVRQSLYIAGYSRENSECAACWDAPDQNIKNSRDYDVDSLMGLLDFVLNEAYVTVGGALRKQTCGIPMGFACSPMIANFVLCAFEIAGIERLTSSALDTPPSMLIATPYGKQLNTPRTRLELLDLAARLARNPRMIDDVLFINFDKHEQKFALELIYEPSTSGLSTSAECCTPGAITHMDMEIKWDRRGLPYTTMYDKRVALAAKGKMGAVRRFPHYDSVMSSGSKFGCLTGHLHRLHTICMRRSDFADGAIAYIVHMNREKYPLPKLRKTLQSFIRHEYLPQKLRGRMA
eukprot:7030961-Prymnesium_polylepis.1